MTFADFSARRPLFQTRPLGDGVTLITDLMGVGKYLIEGTQCAVLLDTGLGIGELAPVIAGLTSLPVKVYLTHGHVDHGGGVFDFDTVYVPEADTDLFAWQTTRQLRRDFAAAYEPQLLEICDLPEHMPWRDIQIQSCRPGDVIDLGGRSLTIVDLRGHTQGSVGYYDSQTGWLFAGDGCNNSTFLFLRESTSVADYRRTLCKLKSEWMPYITRFLICHGPYLDAPISMIDELIECCDRVLEGKGCKLPFVIPYIPFRNGTAYWASEGEDHRMNCDGAFGNLIYCADRKG